MLLKLSIPSGSVCSSPLCGLCLLKSVSHFRVISELCVADANKAHKCMVRSGALYFQLLGTQKALLRVIWKGEGCRDFNNGASLWLVSYLGGYMLFCNRSLSSWFEWHLPKFRCLVDSSLVFGVAFNQFRARNFAHNPKSSFSKLLHLLHFIQLRCFDTFITSSLKQVLRSASLSHLLHIYLYPVFWNSRRWYEAQTQQILSALRV